MRLTLALLRCLIVVVPSIIGRKLTSSRLTLPLESQAHLVPATDNLRQIQLQPSPRHLPTFFAVRLLDAVNSTSSSSEGSSHYSTSTSATSCTETVDGVSVISRVVVNGTRFGACYSNTSFQLSGYPAYLTSQEKNGLAVRGNEGLVVAETEGSNETSLVWALAQFVPDGLELDRVICYNPVGVSSVGTPTSSLLDGEWICDLDGNGGYSRVDDIQIDCGCSAGTDATEYYACEEHEDLALNSSGGFIIDGVSLDGCYTINITTSLFGYYAYFAGPVEDGVPMLFVANYYNALTDEDILYWSLGVYNESVLNPSACFLGVEVSNTTADQTTPLSDGDWVCDLDGDGTYELYDDTVNVQCACIDDSYTTCFENAEGMSLDSSIMYEGDSIGGCFLPTVYSQGDAQVFSLFGDPATTVGSITMSFLHFEDTAINFTGNVWAVSKVRDYDEDKGITTSDIICSALVDDIELPTDPLLQGKWSCRDAVGEYLKLEESDFEEVTCGCRSEAPSGSMSVVVGSSTPVPMLGTTSPPSNLLYPTLSPVATTAPEHPLPSPTRHPEDSDADSTDDASEEKSRQYTPVGIILGGSIGGATLIAGVVTIALIGRSRSRTSVRDSCSSPAGSTSGRGHVGQTRVRNGTSTPQGQNIPPVNPGRPVTTNGYVNGSNDQSSPPSYLDMVKP